MSIRITKTRHWLATLVAFTTLSCGSPKARMVMTKPPVAITTADWVGLYVSPDEISGFASTMLVLENNELSGMSYWVRSHSDTGSRNDIKQDRQNGSCLVEGMVLYLPRASGSTNNGKISLHASMDRYTLLEINGHKVLMRDDALRTFRNENKLYDYGILIKASDDPLLYLLFDNQKIEHPSIKLLYTDPSKPWNDPYVHGANSR